VKRQWDLDNAIGFWLHLTFNKVRADSERSIFAPLGLTPEQWALLVRLWQKDDRTQTELAGETFRDKPSVTRMLDGLENAGFVRRARDQKDARSHRILLTPAGRALEAELVPRVEAFVARLTRGIPARDLATTVATLRALYHNTE
jgi:MarR family transcriptional regulator, organic hydroperoxide resistance regulator